jgi:hypothetical protein
MLISMPLRKKVTSTDATIEARSIRLGRAFALRPASSKVGMAFVVVGIGNCSDASSEGYDPICTIFTGLEQHAGKNFTQI